MRRQGQYADSTVNPMVAAHMQHFSAQRAQHSGRYHFSERQESLHPDEEHQYLSSKMDGQWQWNRDGPRGSNPLSSHSYKEGPGSDASRSLYEGQKSDSNMGLEKQANANQIFQSREEEMEVGYGENTHPQTIEGPEQKFLEDIVKLAKEQQDAEDAENARHRERLSEINVEYQEKILAARARQDTHRDEFLRKESQVRHLQYQQANMNNYQSRAGPSDPHGFGTAETAAVALEEAHRAYAASRFDSYRERPELHGGVRGQGFESQGSYPGGRVYDSGARYF